MLPSTSIRKALLACPPFPPWNLPLFTVESTLSTPCSCSDPLLFRQGAAPAYLPTALSVPLRPLFPFQQAPHVQVFPLKPAPFCMLFAGLGNTNKFAISLLFSSYMTLVLSSPPCPRLHLSSYLKLYGRSGRNCLLSPPVLLDYNGSPDTRFSQERRS